MKSGLYMVYIYIYMCRPEFGEFGEITERPLTENGGGGGGLSERPLNEKRSGGVELKITKKRILLKVGSFGTAMSEKWNKQMYIFEKGGLSVRSRSKKWSLLERPRPKNGGFQAAHTRTALIWEYPPPPHTHTGQT